MRLAIAVFLTVSLVSALLSSCSKKTPTLNAPVPTADFTYNALTPTSDTTPQNLELINTSQNAMAVTWIIPGVGTFTGDTIRTTISRAGTYTVKMVAAGPGGLSDTLSKTVTIAQDNPYAVKAGFTYKLLTPSEATPQNLELINTSQYKMPGKSTWTIPGLGTYTGDTVEVTVTFAGTYNVQLNAAGYGGMTDTLTQTVTINEDNPYAVSPSTLLGVLSGAGLGLTQRTWIANRVINACVVAPGPGSNGDGFNTALSDIDGGITTNWWGYGSGDIATNGSGRDGYLDDQYTFTFDKVGKFIYNDNNTVYLDGGGSTWTKALPAPWNASSTSGTFNSTTPGSYSTTAIYSLVSALKPWGSGNFTYTVAAAPAGAMQLGQITVNGVGAHFGLQDKTNTGELATPTESSITYDVLRISTNLTDASGQAYDEIIIGLTYDANGDVWVFRFRSNR